MSVRIAVVLLACASAACGSLPYTELGQARQVDRLVADVYRISRLPVREQQHELAAARKAYAKSKDAPATVQLALLLSLPGADFQDDALAARLLETLSAAPGATSGLLRYAALLHEHIRDRIRARARHDQRISRLRKQLTVLRAIPPPVINSGDEAARQVANLVTYAHGVSNLPAEEQRNEFFAANRAHAEKPSDYYSRIRLALLLSLPGLPFHDDTSRLLESFAAADASTPLSQFAVLLLRQVSERMRDRKRTAQLREQLEALRAIERSFIERRQSP